MKIPSLFRCPAGSTLENASDAKHISLGKDELVLLLRADERARSSWEQWRVLEKAWRQHVVLSTNGRMQTCTHMSGDVLSADP